MNTDLLKELGLKKAAEKIDKARDLKKRLAIAYENYRFVTPEIFERFQEALKKKTYKETKIDKYHSDHEYHRLVFIKLADYPEVPPPDCLNDLKKANDLKIFDSFDVAKTEVYHYHTDNTPVPDPIIFGNINGCPDKFYITQWFDDVKIEDILKENEG